MVLFKPRSVLAAVLLMAATTLAWARVERIESDDTCWTLLNELAAAAVFADLADDKLEMIYALLDRLQDACEAQNFAEATSIREEIEKLVGK